jgi:hypothetical protein
VKADHLVDSLFLEKKNLTCDHYGIIINEVESLISLYADDTFLILDGSENSLREALECFESFYMVSGLKMNSSEKSIPKTLKFS